MHFMANTLPKPESSDITKEEALQGLENPILSTLEDNNLCQSDIAETIAKIFLKLKTIAEKKQTSLKQLIMVSKEARAWAEILLKLYNAYPVEKKELDLKGDININIVKFAKDNKELGDEKETT